jgi:hypothetical protein
VSPKRFIGQMLVGQMPVGQMPVGQMPVGQMSVGQVVFSHKAETNEDSIFSLIFLSLFSIVLTPRLFVPTILQRKPFCQPNLTFIFI